MKKDSWLRPHARATDVVLMGGAISYAAYVIHVPIIFMVGSTGLNMALQTAICVPTTFALAWILEYRFHPLVLKWIAGSRRSASPSQPG